METPLLEIKNLSVEFATEEGIVRAVNDLSLAVHEGENVALVGESGCGKSVTAMSIPRLLPSSRVVQGEILFQGKDLLKCSQEELRAIRGAGIGMVFQEPMTALSPLRKIGDQLTEGLHLHRDISHADARSLALEWLRRVGIPDPAARMDCFPFELSGGMRQRVMIAMALILEPALLIADEPTTALDVTIQAQILELLREQIGKKTGLLLITHDLGVVWEMCSRIYVMYASRIVETGDKESIFHHPRHPYTQGLLASMPSLHTGKERLPCIPGQVPSLRNLPQGCAFAERCPNRTDQCLNSPPPLMDGCACFNQQGGIAKPHDCK